MAPKPSRMAPQYDPSGQGRSCRRRCPRRGKAPSVEWPSRGEGVGRWFNCRGKEDLTHCLSRAVMGPGWLLYDVHLWIVFEEITVVVNATKEPAELYIGMSMLVRATILSALGRVTHNLPAQPGILVPSDCQEYRIPGILLHV